MASWWSMLHKLECHCFFHICTVILLINTLLNIDFREWRQAGGNQLGVLSFGQAIHDSIPSPPISASRKKQKITPSALSQSFGGPSPFHPQSVDAPVQSSLVEKRGPVSGSKGKKHKPVSKRWIHTVLFISVYLHWAWVWLWCRSGIHNLVLRNNKQATLLFTCRAMHYLVYLQ